MRKKITFFNLSKQALFLAIILLPTRSLWAADMSVDELVEHHCTLNSKATLSLAVGQQNPLDIQVTLNVKGASLANFVTILQKSTGDKAFFNIALDEELKRNNDITLNVKNMTIKEILDRTLPPKGLTYSVKGNVFIISKITKSQTNKITINGVIVEVDTKKPIAGATVIVLGTTNGAISDEKGQFHFYTQLGVEIEVSYTGMKNFNKKVSAADTTLVIALEKDAIVVEDVVVTGIFDKPRESFTGAVTSISSKELKMYRGQNLLSTLRNIDPSVNIVTNNDFGSDPNRLPEVNIRGNSSLPMNVKDLSENTQAQLNTPLIIVDGFEVSLQKLIDFNDEDVETINIMKDASATAIYGSRGANGVIVITTKTPKEGKLKFSVKASLKLEMSDLSSYNMLNATEKLEIERRAGLYDSSTSLGQDFILKKEYNRLLKEVQAGVNTDWLSQPVRNGVGQRYNINLDGGSSQFRWGTSLSYDSTVGTMKGSDRNNFSGGITLSYYYKNLLFKNQTLIGINKSKNTPYGSFSTYVKMNPYLRLYDENGRLIDSYRVTKGNSTTSLGNPLNNALLNSKDETGYKDLTNNFSIEYQIMNKLKVKAKFGISYEINTLDKFKPSNHSDYSAATGDNYFRKGAYQYETGEKTEYEGNLTVSYSNIFNDAHQFYAGVDYSIQQKDSYKYQFDVEGFPYENQSFLANSLSYAQGAPKGYENMSRRIGLTGNLNYTYKNRYYLDGSFRIDGSSQFGTKNKFAPFWSLGIGWNIHQESFLEQSKVIDKLRLKLAYGSTGSQQFSAYQARSTYTYYVGDRYLNVNGAYLKGLGNENLKWQVTDQINLGAETTMFDRLLSFSLDIYTKETSGLLSQIEIPTLHGFRSYTSNVGEIGNKGFEGMISGYLIRNNKNRIMLSMTAKIAYNKNTILKLSDEIKSQTEEQKIAGASTKLLYEGDSQNDLYLVRSLGIDPSNGMEVFLKNDGSITYEWDARDRVNIGVSQPKYRGNLSTMFQFKEFTLNLSFAYHWGGVLHNNTLIDKVENANFGDNVDRRAFYERWQKIDDVVAFKSIYDTKKTNMSSRFVQKDNAIQLQSVNLSYRLSNNWLRSKLNVQSINFGFNMSDVFYLSTVKNERGVNYPFARRMEFSLGLMF